MYKIIRTNKRERTITIRHDYTKSNGHVLYKSYPLSEDDFRYYSHYATENDIKNFLLESGEYYVLHENR